MPFSVYQTPFITGRLRCCQKGTCRFIETLNENCSSPYLKGLCNCIFQSLDLCFNIRQVRAIDCVIEFLGRICNTPNLFSFNHATKFLLYPPGHFIDQLPCFIFYFGLFFFSFSYDFKLCPLFAPS